jgi:ABC-2 type transport system ATP-binding protein
MVQTLPAKTIKTEPILSVAGLKKNYGNTNAVKGLDFDVYQGEIFGLIGPDGAGKTTTFHILGGVLEASAGEVSVLGRKPRDSRLEIGYLTQQFSLYLDLSIQENLRYSAGLRSADLDKAQFEERCETYLTMMSLAKFRDRLAGQLSGGMKQKLALCCALIARPKVLLLDEPTTGVDPVSRREFWDLVAQVTRDGVTVAVATPYLDEAERCTRLILMHEGAVEEMGSPAQLRHNLGMHRLEVRCGKIEALERSLQSVEATATIKDIQTFGDRLDVLAVDPGPATAAVTRAAAQLGISDLTIDLQQPTLENVFVSRLKDKIGESQRQPFPFIVNADTNSHAQRADAGEGGSAIEAEGVSKMFGSFQAVNNVNLNVQYGEIYGLLGANGAGKTTTIKILCGLIPPSAGRMSLGGRQSNLRSKTLRQKLGYMSQKFTLYDDLTIIENLEFYCGVYLVPLSLQRERINWVLKNSDLVGQESMLTGKLPGGWKQRLSFGAAVMHQPEILFLDEPTSGVDPLARREMWRSIRELARQGTAVLVTTHFLEEAEQCNNLGFMVAGVVVAEGSPSSIKTSQPGQLFEVRYDDLAGAYGRLKTIIAPWRVSMFADSLHIVLDHPESDWPRIESELAASGPNPGEVSRRLLGFSLEDSFISIVQRASGAAG